MAGERLRALVTALACSLVAGCAEPEAAPAEREAMAVRAEVLAGALADAPIEAHKGLVVRLMFDDNVDLDLYVTDPLLETVYFARHDSRTGGRIVSDVRCDTSGPRVEEIRFPEPWSGRYRVGVDFPHRCDGSASRAPAPFAVAVSRDGRLLNEVHGLVEREFFEVRVLEFEIDNPAGTGQATGS